MLGTNIGYEIITLSISNISLCLHNNEVIDGRLPLENYVRSSYIHI